MCPLKRQRYSQDAAKYDIFLMTATNVYIHRSYLVFSAVFLSLCGNIISTSENKRLKNHGKKILVKITKNGIPMSRRV